VYQPRPKLKLPSLFDNLALIDPDPVTDATDTEPVAFPGKIADEFGGECDRCESSSGRDATPLNPCLTKYARCLWSGVCAGECPSCWLPVMLIPGLKSPEGGESEGGVNIGPDSWTAPFLVGRLVETLVSDWFAGRSYKEGLESPGDFTDGVSGVASPLPLPIAKRRISSLKFFRKSFSRVHSCIVSISAGHI
jgi:hypothetical protein